MEHWVYTYQDFLGGWETYGHYPTREEVMGIIALLTKQGKRWKVITIDDFSFIKK